MSDTIDQFDEAAAPKPELLTPKARTFKGKALAPYSFARRLIGRMVLRTEQEPADEVWSLALVFILSLPEAEAQAMLYDKAGFKVALFKWIDGLDASDYPAAVALADEITKEATEARVKIADDPASMAEGAKKKPRAGRGNLGLRDTRPRMADRPRGDLLAMADREVLALDARALSRARNDMRTVLRHRIRAR